MSRCQVDQLNPTAAEKRVTGDEKCIGPRAHKRREDRIDVLAGLGLGVGRAAQAKPFEDYLKPAPIVCSPLSSATWGVAGVNRGRSETQLRLTYQF